MYLTDAQGSFLTSPHPLSSCRPLALAFLGVWAIGCVEPPAATCPQEPDQSLSEEMDATPADMSTMKDSSSPEDMPSAGEEMDVEMSDMTDMEDATDIQNMAPDQ